MVPAISLRMDRNVAKATYSTFRAASKLSKADFDDEARSAAYELADGEEVTAYHWVRGAAQVLSGRNEWKPSFGAMFRAALSA